jgi:uncharacterized protein
VKPPVPGGSLPGDKSLPAPDPTYVQLVRTYGPGRFQISEREWKEPVVVTDVKTAAWAARTVEDLSPDMLKDLPGIELLVVGCGARVAFVPPAKRAAFKAKGVSLEVVDTGSACRIYNVLLAEGRRVAAALIPL